MTVVILLVQPMNVTNAHLHVPTTMMLFDYYFDMHKTTCFRTNSR